MIARNKKSTTKPKAVTRSYSPDKKKAAFPLNEQKHGESTCFL